MTSWFRSGTSGAARPPLACSLCLCAAVLLGPLPAWADAGAELLGRIDALGHLAADFTQDQYGPSGELLEQATGQVRLLRPKFRWEVTSPYPQVIVADADELSVYDPDLEQVVVRPIDEALADTPLALLTRSTLALNADYQVSRLGEGAFSLRPRSDDALIAEVVLAFAGDQLQELIIRDSLGHRTDIAFSRFQDASVIESADFTLDLPLGVEFHQGR